MSTCSYCRNEHPTPRSGTTGEQLPGPCISVLSEQVATLNQALGELAQKVDEESARREALRQEILPSLRARSGATAPPAASPAPEPEAAAADAPAPTEPSSK